MRTTPDWELYGDGTLLYQPQPFSRDPLLLQAELARADIASILEVVVTQHAFFTDPKRCYGQSNPDEGYWVLTVTVKKQSKTVWLGEEENVPPEDQHMFAILHFLQSYQPTAAHPYAAPGAILLVQPDTGSFPAVAWPYPDIALQQVAAQECRIFHPYEQRACPATSASTGLFPLYGARGAELFQLLDRQGYHTCLP
jgi:hypothetical protein